ncbi:SDR family NAD(P)-dependent oxidoreductase [Nucisporomicrobium flavum]|uniref:SDR family NAD(P)-dependent oxidoreductase n=1 Tax=Nucisporomicrobium flavum TaxID=2785915 RepID=UPI0018F5C96B|nr:SDR family NAD(P)-dependent oxidoreductase [Nucisporomicrobium flavum]
MDTDLSGRTVLVTGGSRGIGREITRAFASEGARVALTYQRDRDGAEALCEQLRAQGGEVLAVPYSLAEPGSVREVVAAVRRVWGDPDVLVANAALRPPRRAPSAPLEDIEDGQWEPVIEHNVLGTVRLVRTVLPGMRRRKWGRVVLLSSHNALGGNPGQELMGSAKAALHGFARSLSWNVGPDGILINVVCPGLTTTADVLAKLPREVIDREVAATPTGRLSSPEDIAGMVVFLGSGTNTNITGEALTVAGGR